MRNNQNHVFLTSILTAVLCISGKLIAYSDGYGTEKSPYQISNVADFQQLSTTPTDWNKFFILTADIDLSGLTFTRSPIAPDTDSSSYNFQGTVFTGIFDGEGHKISNLTVHVPTQDYYPYYIGLFGYVGSSGQIKNLGVENIIVDGDDYVGGLVGYNKGSLTDCYATGSVTGVHYAGGLVGENSGGTVTLCYAIGTVNGSGTTVGGLVGENNNKISSCYASGSVAGSSEVGGLIGFNYGGKITHCYATCLITCSYSSAGGLVGTNTQFGTITTCYAAGAVSGSDYVGGLVGDNYGTLTACFFDTQISGKAFGVGSGHSTGVTGKTTTQMQTLSTFTDASWDFSNTYFDPADWIMSGYPHMIWEISGAVPEVIGQAHNQAQASLLLANLCVNNNWVASDVIPFGQVIIQSPAAGTMISGGTLVNLFISGGSKYAGSGTVEAPYQIDDKFELWLLANTPSDYDKSFILMMDIDMAGLTFTQGIAPDTDYFKSDFQGTAFTGIFDGKGHTISNLTINASTQDYVGLFGYVGSGCKVRNLGINVSTQNYVGLFGYVGPGGKVCNLGIQNANITGGVYVGGLVGENVSGLLTSCYVIGSVSGSSTVGGLVGMNDATGTLTFCYAMGTVSGTEYNVGGLVGYNKGSLADCYATGSVNGKDGVGGLAGDNWGGTITSCYATGSVNGKDEVGGLVGYGGDLTSCYATGSVSGVDNVGGLVGSGGNLTSCYATGSVSGTGSDVGGLLGYNYYDAILTACFWDTQTSGKTVGVGYGSSTGVTGKTTAQMKTLSTFTNAGWDFSTTDGDPADWQMSSNDYPRLVWESFVSIVATPVISPNGGTFTDPTLVTLSCSTSGATIRYTTNGIDPTSSSTKYTGAFTVSSSCTIKARGFMSGYTDSDVASASFVINLVASLTIQKCSVTAGNILDTISFSGILNATEADLLGASNIVVSINANDMTQPLDFTFPINTATLKKGKFSSKSSNLSFALDTKTGKITFSAKNVDLTGLACPVTVTITIGSYTAKFELNESIVNGTKPCPLPLMMGVKDSLTVAKAVVKHGKKLNTDSLAISGTFTIAGSYSKSDPLAITLGGQTFTVPGGQFVGKNRIESCKTDSNEGPLVTAKLDFAKCAYTISVKNAEISQNGTVDFGINCFGVNLEGWATVNLN